MNESWASAKRVAVVIPNYNGARWLTGCLAGLAAQTFQDFEVVLVDNGSTDESVELTRRSWPDARVVSLTKNQGFARAVNAGIRATRTPLVVLLNNDTQPKPGWLAALVTGIDGGPPTLAGSASLMLSLDDPTRIDDAGDSLSWQGAAHKIGHGQRLDGFPLHPEPLSPCAGAALYRRSFLEDVGGFDESFFAYLEDVDLGLRGRLLGYQFRLIPEARVLHKGHGSRIPTGFYVSQTTRNRLALFIKNIPSRLLWRHAADILYGQLYFAVAHRRPGATARGLAWFLRDLPHILRQRRAFLPRVVLPHEEIEQLLEAEIGEAPLRQLRWFPGGQTRP